MSLTDPLDDAATTPDASEAVATPDFVDFLKDETRSCLEGSTLGSAWSGLQGALWQQGDDAFVAPPLDAHFMALCTQGLSVADIRFAALTGAPVSIISDGAICFMPAGNACQFRAEGRFETFHVMVRKEMVRDCLATMMKGDPDRVELQGFTGHHDEKFERLLRALLAEMKRPNHGDALAADAQAIALAERLVDYASNVPVTEPKSATLSPLQLKNAIDFMEACLTRDFGIDEIAAFVGMPARPFAAAFEEATGITLSAFRTERRLDYVREWMSAANCQATATELAKRAGFGSAEALDAAFCSHIGITFENYRHGRLG